LEVIRMQSQQSHVLYHTLGTDYATIVRADGVYVFDQNGKRYLDAIGGVGVVNIGHGVEEVIGAMTRQLRTIAFSYGGLVDNEPQRELANRLDRWAPRGMGATKTLFGSGGAEASEGALKLAYQYHWERGNPTKQKVIGRWQSFHGNSIGALSMSGRTSWRRMHSPYLLDFPHIPPPYCYRCPWDKTYPSCGIACARELQRVIQQVGPENIAAFIAEPVIGTSMSAVVPPAEYYPMVREICNENDVLFIVDEVMSGVGRTGKRWAIEHWGVTPDMITCSKGVSGGYTPLSILMLRDKVWQAIADGSKTVMQSSTYGGNPVSCAAGVAVLDYIEDNDLVSRAAEKGDKLLAGLQAAVGDLPHVGQVRGKGLFIGIELVADKETKAPFPVQAKITEHVEKVAFNRGLLVLGGVAGLIDGAAGDHFEILPPYVVDDEHLDFIVDTVREVILEATSERH
jgi:adenosylmethionine-8-amino-7-oxononanoate aminotransferase